jgi:ATP-dependent Zn protease
MRGPAAPGLELIRVAALVLLLIVLGLGLLYAYRSRAPSVPEVDIGTAIQDINAGQVRAVTIVGNKATLEFRDGHKEQTTVPQPDTIFAPSVAGYNATHPSQPVELRYTPQESQPVAGVVGSILLSLLPVLLIGGFFYYTMRARRGP